MGTMREWICRYHEAVDMKDRNSINGLVTELYEMSYEQTYKFMYHRCHNQGIAVQLTQDTYLKIIKMINKGNRFSNGLNPHVVANSVFIDYKRVRKNRDEISLSDVISTSCDEDESDIDISRCKYGTSSQSIYNHQVFPDPEDSIINKETHHELYQAMVNNMNETHRAILLDRFFYDSDYAEGADRLGISVSAYKARLHRARESLKTRINQAQL